MAFPFSICMLIYGVSNGSVAGLINEVLVRISSALGLLLLDRKKEKSNN